MYRLKVFFAFIISIFLFICFPDPAAADSSDHFITIVNPVRISSYNKFPAQSLKNEYLVIRKNVLPATWLLTYDAIQNASVVSVVNSMDKKQELGIFLEVTKTFAEESGVTYHNTGSWHHAASVFLSGYTQDERKKLIDKVFETFKGKFGYYPSSVGSWWTDSFSLSYMKEKYGITANLTCSDQLTTDGYQIWGQPWALPYYPSKFYTVVPASGNTNKLDVVNLQWAPRDPLNGYDSSLYSTQDYMVAPKPQKIDYFQKLVELYVSHGQITVGLESDLDPDAYKYEYAKQIDIVSNMRKTGVQIITMSDYSNWYRQKYPKISPPTLIKSDDLLGTSTKAFWYSGPNYRIFYTKNSEGLQIKDLRVYNSNLQEPYFVSPNYSFGLSINIPYVISASENPGDAWVLPDGAGLVTTETSIQIKGSDLKIPNKIKNSKLINIKKQNDGVTISFPDLDIARTGTPYRDFSPEAIHFFRQKKAILSLLTGKGWNYLKKINYLIPQGEIYALLFLRSLPPGRVLVYDHECLQCIYHVKLPPPSFSDRRGYIKDYSGHPILYSTSIFEAKERVKAKEEIKKIGAKYVYLVKFENYEEKIPFSPGDLGVEKIFSNANAEIWEVK